MELTDTENEVVEALYSAVAEERGFDALIAACAARLERRDRRREPDFATPAVSRHVERALELVCRPLREPQGGGNEAVITLTPGGVVFEANEAAAGRFGVVASARADLSFVAPSSRSDLDRVRAAAVNGANRRHAILRLEPKTGGTALAEAFAAETGLVTIRVIEPVWSAATGDILAESFGLTAAEIEVGRLLTIEGDGAAVAKRRGTTPETVRTQLKTIFWKTGARNQVELVRMLTLVSSRAEGGSHSAEPLWRDPLGREKTFIDDEGRKIAFSWMGAKAGRPLILVHGMATGYFLPECIQDALCAAGLTVLTVCRPGFGNSEPALDDDPIGAGARAVLSLMNRFGIEQAGGIGLVSGTIPLVRAAAMAPDRFGRLVSLGGCLPLDGPEARAGLPVNHRVVLELSSHAPGILELAVTATARTVKRQGVRFILERMYSWCEADRAVLQDEEKAARLMASAQMLLAQGPRTMLRDMAMLGVPWEDDLRTAGLPLHILHGDEDPVYRPEAIANFARRNTQIRAEEIEGCGQLLAYQAPERVCDVLIAAAR